MSIRYTLKTEVSKYVVAVADVGAEEALVLANCYRITNVTTK